MPLISVAGNKKSVISHYEPEAQVTNPDGIYFTTFAVVGWVDVFTRDVYRGIFVDSLNWSIKNKGLVVHAWVLMTNHVHLIVSKRGELKLEEIFRVLRNSLQSK